MPNETGYKDIYGDLGTGDVNAAKTTLQDKGWTLGSDGIFAKNGTRLSIKIGHKIVPHRTDSTRLIQDKCHQAGIEVIDDQAKNFNSVRLTASEFDVALFAWVGNPMKSGSAGQYMSKDKGGVNNYNLYTNAAADDLWAKANAELDYTKRVQELNQIDQIMHDDYTSLPLFQQEDFAASVAGFGPTTVVQFAGGVLWNAETWQKK
jgi:peptide/nickel transport system substrate-binding protein